VSYKILSTAELPFKGSGDFRHSLLYHSKLKQLKLFNFEKILSKLLSPGTCKFWPDTIFILSCHAFSYTERTVFLLFYVAWIL